MSIIVRVRGKQRDPKGKASNFFFFFFWKSDILGSEG